MAVSVIVLVIPLGNVSELVEHNWQEERAPTSDVGLCQERRFILFCGKGQLTLSYQ